jgi:adenine-specific DNA-methyltransferase
VIDLIFCKLTKTRYISEEARRYGRLTVLPARINSDLQMGGDLLKKTGAGNLFGEIRSSSTDDIVCWFIDTDYNKESFFVRHAYFTGADEPYEKLKRPMG